jgi:hypothetical protein
MYNRSLAALYLAALHEIGTSKIGNIEGLGQRTRFPDQCTAELAECLAFIQS